MLHGSPSRSTTTTTSRHGTSRNGDPFASPPARRRGAASMVSTTVSVLEAFSTPPDDGDDDGEPQQQQHKRNNSKKQHKSSAASSAGATGTKQPAVPSGVNRKLKVSSTRSGDHNYDEDERSSLHSNNNNKRHDAAAAAAAGGGGEDKDQHRPPVAFVVAKKKKKASGASPESKQSPNRSRANTTDIYKQKRKHGSSSISQKDNRVSSLSPKKKKSRSIEQSNDARPFAARYAESYHHRPTLQSASQLLSAGARSMEASSSPRRSVGPRGNAHWSDDASSFASIHSSDEEEEARDGERSGRNDSYYKYQHPPKKSSPQVKPSRSATSNGKPSSIRHHASSLMLSEAGTSLSAMFEVSADSPQWTEVMAPAHMLRDEIHKYMVQRQQEVEQRGRRPMSDGEIRFLHDWSDDVGKKLLDQNDLVVENLELSDNRKNVNKSIKKERGEYFFCEFGGATPSH